MRYRLAKKIQKRPWKYPVGHQRIANDRCDRAEGFAAGTSNKILDFTIGALENCFWKDRLSRGVQDNLWMVQPGMPLYGLHLWTVPTGS